VTTPCASVKRSKPTHSSKNCLTKTPTTTSNSLPSTPKSASKARSVFADILNLPNQTPTGRRKAKSVSGARVLTSIEARHMLEEKERKKQEEKEEKEQKKKEREQKKLQRQEEQRKKQEERAAKQAKRAQKKAKKATNSKKRKAGETSAQATNPKKKRSDSDNGLQGREVSSNECARCFGLYDEDVDPDTGDVTCDWIQCTSDNCGVWMHTECLAKCDGDYVCCVCETLFS